MRRMLIFAHTNEEKSLVNRALIESLEGFDIDVHNLNNAIVNLNLYEQRFNVEFEHEQLRTHDEICVQFPLYWYNCPPILKEYEDEILTPLLKDKSVLNEKIVKFIITTGEKRIFYDKMQRHNINTFERILYPHVLAFENCGAIVYNKIFAICKEDEDTEDKITWNEDLSNLPIQQYLEFLEVV